jgi:hypothetical protein
MSCIEVDAITTPVRPKIPRDVGSAEDFLQKAGDEIQALLEREKQQFGTAASGGPQG